LVVDQHCRVAVEADIAAVAPALLFDRADDDRLDDLPFLHVRLGGRFLHRRGDDIAEPRVAAGRPANRVDDRDLAGARIVGAVQDRSHLNHDTFSVAGSTSFVCGAASAAPRESGPLPESRPIRPKPDPTGAVNETARLPPPAAPRA